MNPTFGALPASILPPAHMHEPVASSACRPPPEYSPQFKPPHSIETLHEDVLHMIALELRGRQNALHELASCSRTLRTLVAPVLFYKCKTVAQAGFPDAIRLLVRHLCIVQLLPGEHFTPEQFECLLDSLPCLTEITFDDPRFMISCDILKKCLARPCLRSIAFSSRINFTLIEPYPADQASAMSVQLTTFSCKRPFWLEGKHGGYRRMPTTPEALEKLFSHESACISAVVLGMSSTARQLTLPMEAALFPNMAKLTWPILRHLTIEGRYVDQAHADTLPVLLSSLSQLSSLSVQVCRRRNIDEAPILGSHPSPSTILVGLKSLTVAFPDPEDDIFSVDATQMTHLSLRDCPRYYHLRSRSYCEMWAMPVLSSTDCLSILKRMDLPRLSSLELVYRAESVESDNELLGYIAVTYPRLSHLELHRYRYDWTEHWQVDHKHIARLLTPLKSLRSVHLNLDFPDDHGPYCSNHRKRDAWFKIFKKRRGPEIVDILQECPYLEYVGLLYHGYPSATWAEFHPLRCAKPRFVLSYDPAHVDSEPVPVSWYRPKMRTSAPAFE